MPASSNVVCDWLLNIFATSTVIIMVTIPKMNAVKLINTPVQPKTIAMVAPNPAPVDKDVILTIHDFKKSCG